jgi:hypothetical protein
VSLAPEGRPRGDRGSKWDACLLDGQASEDAFVHAICWSRFEVKADHMAERTGNHAVEFERRRLDGTTEPSGIAVTKAQWWAVEYRRNQRRWLVVWVPELRKLASRARREGRVRWGGDGDRSHLALVPLEWLVEREQAAA